MFNSYFEMSVLLDYNDLNYIYDIINMHTCISHLTSDGMQQEHFHLFKNTDTI